MIVWLSMFLDENLTRSNLMEMSNALARSSPAEIQDFLYSILTPAEADEIAKRWALVKDLAQGKPQRQIAHELGLSLCKITRGSRELKKEDSSFKLMLDRAGVPVLQDAAIRKRKRENQKARTPEETPPIPEPSR